MTQITCPHCGDTYPDFDVAHVCSSGLYAPRLKPKINERIKEIERQCWKSTDADPYAFFDVKKFAELIVRECAKVCDDLDIDDWGDKSFDDGTYYCSRAIKQHFGVEE